MKRLAEKRKRKADEKLPSILIQTGGTEITFSSECKDKRLVVNREVLCSEGLNSFSIF